MVYDHSGRGTGFCPKRFTHGLIISVASIIALCKKHAIEASIKLRPNLVRQPKRLLNQISNKTTTLMHHKKRNAHDRGLDAAAPNDFADSGVWHRPSKIHDHSGSGASFSPKRFKHGLMISVASIIDLCKKHAIQASIKLKPKLVRQPKRLLNQISSKTMTLMHHKKRNGRDRGLDIVAPDDFGDGGVWQREILMGDKCQPLNFSGVIYYDHTGKALTEFPPRSPRASPLPAYLTRVK